MLYSIFIYLFLQNKADTLELLFVFVFHNHTVEKSGKKKKKKSRLTIGKISYLKLKPNKFCQVDTFLRMFHISLGKSTKKTYLTRKYRTKEYKPTSVW